MQIKIDINVCRVCLQSGDPSAPLFDDSRDTDYAAKFKLTTQLKVKICKSSQNVVTQKMRHLVPRSRCTRDMNFMA